MKHFKKSITLTKQVEWHMGHRIIGHPKDQHLHGHHFVLEVTVASQKFLDISSLAQVLRETIVTPFDHSFAFSQNDQIMKEFFTSHKNLRHIILKNEPTWENLLIMISEKLEKQELFQKNVRLKKLTLWGSPTSSATLKF